MTLLNVSQAEERHFDLALQLHFYFDSESMCHHDSEVMDGGGIDRDDA